MKRLVLAGLISIVLGQMPAKSAQFSASASPNFSTGKYGGTDKTDVFEVPLRLSYSNPRFSLGVTIPYLAITSAGGVLPIAGQVVATGGSLAPTPGGGFSGGSAGSVNPQAIVPLSHVSTHTVARTTQQGIGDTVVALTTTLWDEKDFLPSFFVGGNIKIPTADKKKSLGTGEYDYGVKSGLSKYFGAFSIFADGAYTWVGNPPGLTLSDILSYGGGVGYAWTKSVETSVSVSGARAAFKGTPAPLEVGLDVQKRFSQLTLGLSAGKGLSTASPDWFGGFSASWRL